MRFLLTMPQEDKKTGLHVVYKNSAGKIRVQETLSSLSIFVHKTILSRHTLHAGCPLGVPMGNNIAIESAAHSRKKEREEQAPQCEDSGSLCMTACLLVCLKQCVTSRKLLSADLHYALFPQRLA